MTNSITPRPRRLARPRSPEEIEFDDAGETLARNLFGSEAGEARFEFRGAHFTVAKLADPARLGSPLRIMISHADDQRAEVLAIVRSMIGEA